MRDLIRCIVYNPVEWGTSGAAVAAVRAGGSGVLCALHGGQERLAELVHQTKPYVPKDGMLGVRIGLTWACSNIDQFRAVIKAGPSFVIVAEGFASLMQKDTDCDTRALLRCQPLIAEVTSVEELRFARARLDWVSAWILTGQEAGGRVGSMSTQVLLQMALKEQIKEPLAVRGGFGLMGAAAIVAAGAAGVVLDDQILLLKESPWAAKHYAWLSRLSGQESVVLGLAYGDGYRFLNRPEFTRAEHIAAVFKNLEGSELDDAGVSKAWRKEMSETLRWTFDHRSLWPVGQAVGFAEPLAVKLGTVGRLVQAVLRETPIYIRSAVATQPLKLGGALAKAHGTRYPVVQGPMTRASDRTAFAAEVSRHGGLPFLALAVMKGREVEMLLEEATKVLADIPWGVGILGFISPELKAEQMIAIRKFRPPFAVVAGGHPDLVDELEAEGISAYLHVPAPSLLAAFYRRGIRRFIFEGRECGGHVGPLGSLVLWEHAVRILLTEVPEGEENKVHVLFAGGVHDACSAAIASVILSPLAAKGMRTGVLMGTAYIGTVEAVATGAISETFQREIFCCADTVTLESGLGHANRCARTPFVDEFRQYRRKLIRNGLGSERIKHELDQLGLGRLRLATKGLERGEDGSLVSTESARQRARGMFMIGEVGVFCRQPVSVAELHRDVCERVDSFIRDAASKFSISVKEPMSLSTPSDIAVIGMSCILPGSQDPDQFWTNLIAKRVAIREIPEDRFDWKLYFENDRNAKDKIYSRWGGFIDDIPFDPMFFGIPPKVLQSISPVQLITLEGVRRALIDAGLGHVHFDRDNTEVIIGNSDGGGFINDLLRTRTVLPMIAGEIPPELEERLPHWTGESFPGTINSIAAGRVASRFGFGGLSMTIDAACAASLSALDVAVTNLENFRCNLAIAGGADCANSPFSYMGFSKTQALSPDGQVRTFDKKANGIVISEGAAFVVLKRLKDAERDGDKIYGVIKSVASSSDGRGTGLTAPNSEGQQRALRRAYRKAGFGPETVAFYESHGTGTALGDKTEVETIVSVLKESGARAKDCIIGSHKTLIGHTKTAAGLVGLVKVLKSIEHRSLPPHVGVNDPLDALADCESPIALLDQVKPWFVDARFPRRCSVSGFGFGGVNVHAVVEEYQGTFERPILGGRSWPAELFLVRAENKIGLIHKIKSMVEACELDRSLAELARDLNREWDASPSTGPAMSLVAESVDDARHKLARIKRFLEGEGKEELPCYSFLTDGNDSICKGKVAILFPGQGSQHLGMLREPAVFLDDIRESLERANEICLSHLGCRLSDRIYPTKVFDRPSMTKQIDDLNQTYLAQPALAAFAVGITQLLNAAGVSPSMFAGHSFGEISSLYAAGALDAHEFIEFAKTRGHLMNIAEQSLGAMAAVFASPETVATLLTDFPGLMLAAINSPKQSVISGLRPLVIEAVEKLQQRGYKSLVLPSSGAFHSPYVEPAMAPLKKIIGLLPIKLATIPVYSNETRSVMPTDPEQLRERMATHLIRPVQFLPMVRAMYADGARIFVEVGPHRVLTDLVCQCLEGQQFRAISLDDGSGRLAPFLAGLGVMACLGVVRRLDFLWARRSLSKPSTAIVVGQGEAKAVSWFVNGMFVRSASNQNYGAKPLLSAEGTAGMICTKKRNTSSSSTNMTSKASDLSTDNSVQNDPIVAAYIAYQQTMQQFLRTQEGVMKAFFGEQIVSPSTAQFTPPRLSQENAAEFAPVSSNNDTKKIPSQSNSEVIAPKNGQEFSKESIATSVLRTVSACTGYPVEVLGLSRDMEGDLGLDSVKQMEIFHALQGELAPEIMSQLGDSLDTMPKARTLGALIDFIFQAVRRRLIDNTALSVGLDKLTPASSHNGLLRHNKNGHDKLSDKSCPRFVMQGRLAPLPVLGGRKIVGLFLITPDELGVAEILYDSIKSAGASPVIVPVSEGVEEYSKLIADARVLHGPVKGIVHLAGLSQGRGIPESFDAWKRGTSASIKGLFLLIKACHKDLSAGDSNDFKCVISTSVTGGWFGRQGDVLNGDLIAAAASGLLKTLKAEIPTVFPKAVDLSLDLSKEQMAEYLMAEILTRSCRVEVGYPEGRRVIFEVVREDLENEKIQNKRLPDDAVVLAIGGGMGITAEALKTIVRPGMKLVLVGKSKQVPEPAEYREFRTADDLRRYFLSLAVFRQEMPIAIERRIANILRMRARVATLNEFQARGLDVDYLSVDMRQESEVVTLIQTIYAKFGRLDAVLHGGGVIADKLIETKTIESFDEVFDTKADSIYLLAKHLRPESLKLFVLFGSTAGRFGNRGQCDYAAGNELLNRMAWYLHHRWRKTRILCINWGPWGEAGMASSAVNKQFLDRGITPISTAAGCEFLRREINDDMNTVEVIAGDGPWEAMESSSEPVPASILEKADSQ